MARRCACGDDKAGIAMLVSLLARYSKIVIPELSTHVLHLLLRSRREEIATAQPSGSLTLLVLFMVTPLTVVLLASSATRSSNVAEVFVRSRTLSSYGTAKGQMITHPEVLCASTSCFNSGGTSRVH